VLPSSYVQIVDNDEPVVDDNKGLPPPSSQHSQTQQQTTCLDEATCPFIQQRPHSSLSMTDQQQQQQQHRRRLGSFNISKTAGGGSQSTLNTLCSYSRKSREHQQHQQQQHNAVYNRLYHSDPSTHMLGTQTTVDDGEEHLSNYAHIKHSHRHPHYHLRRQSQPDEPLRLMSRNSSSMKSFTSQCYINPEYFYEIRPSRSCDDDDSKASLIPRKPSQNQIMLLNSELHLLEGLHGEHSHSYPKINYLERRYLLDDEVDGDDYSTVPREVTDSNGLSMNVYGDEEADEEEEEEMANSSSETEPSDASEFHENKTSTLDRQKVFDGTSKKSTTTKKSPARPPPPIPPPIFSETDSYSTVNDEITQLVSKHLSNSIKQLVARRFIEIESYSLPLRRRHSCDSSELSDIVIPDLFNSPSRIKWNFLTGLPDRSRSQSQIYSSDYKTDEDDEDCEEEEEEEEDMAPANQTQEDEIDEIHKLKSSSLDYNFHHLLHHQRYHMPIWHTNSYGSSSNTTNTTATLHRHRRHHRDDAADDGNEIHHNEFVENCCATHFMRAVPYGGGGTSSSTHDDDTKYGSSSGKGEGEDDARVYEFELCTKENCEYLSKSQIPSEGGGAVGMEDEKNLLNNEKMPNMPSNQGGSNSNGTGERNHKNINLKHNKFKKTKKTKKGGKTKENREQEATEDDRVLMWNKIDLNHLMKKESCNINSVNLKPHSSSSSTSSVNNVGNHRRNLKRHQKKACDKLFTTSSLSQRQQQSLNVTSLILASSATSTQARIRNDGGIYFSNPDLSSLPPDLRSLNFINNSNNTTSSNNNNNNSCQFINNDLRSNGNSVNSRSRFDSRFNNLNSATNYLLLESINSNNIDNSNSDELMQQQDLRRRLRYINLHGIIRRAQRRARKYLNSLSFASSRK
jgi:hypothetical protein